MDKLITLFFFPIALMVGYPFLAFVPAGSFLSFYFWQRNRGESAHSKKAFFRVLLCGLAWLVFAIYEYRMYYWSKTVVAPIRVDLLLITPILYLFTIAGFLAIWRILKRTEK